MEKTVLLWGGARSLAESLATELSRRGYGTQVLTQTDWSQSSALPSQTAQSLKAAILYLDSELETIDFSKFFGALAHSEKILFDFCDPSVEVREVWGALDDVVMGGVSESNLVLTGEGALFCGNVSVANSGGFASTRTRNFAEPFDLSDCEGVELRVKGDGKRYKFILRNSGRWDDVAFCFSFDTVFGIWTTVRVPFAELVPTFRARTVPDAVFDPSNVSAVQMMLSKFEYDRQLNPNFSPGAFQLQVASIGTYGNQNRPRVVLAIPAGTNRARAAEEALQNSGLPHAIARIGSLSSSNGGNLGDNLLFDRDSNAEPSGAIGARDFARLCGELLALPDCDSFTFSVRQDPQGIVPRDWGRALKAFAERPHKEIANS